MRIQELFSLKERVAIITGGSRGIGKFIATGLAEAGADVVLASRKIDNCIETAKEIGAKSILAQAYHDLGLLHKAKARSEQARDCFSIAIQIFKECETEVYLKESREALRSLQ